MGNVRDDQFVETDSEYGRGIGVNIYKGKYSLVEARENKSGEIWMEWGYRSVRENGQSVPSEKTFPMSLRIGDTQEEAEETLKQLLDIVRRRSEQKATPRYAGEDDDIAF